MIQRYTSASSEFMALYKCCYCYFIIIWNIINRQLIDFLLVRCRIRLVKTVISKPFYRFPTGSRFSERITGYRTYRTSRQHDPGNTDADILRCRECRCPLFSRNSSVVVNFWASVSANGRLSTSAVHICCPNTWTVLYFWMEISIRVGLVAEFVHQRYWRFSVMQWHEVGQYSEQTHLSHVRYSLAQTEFTAKSFMKSPTHVGQQ